MHDFPYNENKRDFPNHRRAQFHEGDKTALANCLRVAAERFMEHAAEFRMLIDHQPEPNALMQIHGDGARRLAEQFEYQAREARQYADVFENADQILDILYEVDD
jgi:hypothetical protein